MSLPAPAILFTFVLLSIPSTLADRKFTINNNCNVTLWPAIYSNTFVANSGNYTGQTGWEAQAHSSQSVSIPEGWIGRIWGRQGCNFSSGNGSCVVGDCNGALECTTIGTPPYTLLEWAVSSSVGSDFYDISLVDGFNLPVEMKSNNACPSIACLTNFNTGCPTSLVGEKQGDTVLSCTNDQKHEDWFRSGCPQVYVTPYDDTNAAFSNQTCPGGQAADYTLTFCPFGTVNGTAPGAASSSAGPSSTSSSTTLPSSTNSETPIALNSGSKSLSGGAIAGIVIGALCALGLVLFAVWFLLRRRKRPQDELAEKNGGPRNVEPFTGGAYVTSTLGVGADVLTRSHGKSGETATVSPTSYISPTTRRTKAMEAGVTSPSDATSSSSFLAYPPPPASANSNAPLSPQQGGSSHRDRSENIDLDRIFEDRVHEDQLLAFIARRMDRNTRPEDDEGSLAPPPTYRPS